MRTGGIPTTQLPTALTPPWTRCTTRVLPSASRRGQRVNEEQPLSTGFPGSIWVRVEAIRHVAAWPLACSTAARHSRPSFFWPSSANEEPNKWKVVDCTAHNNEQLGFFAWQNDPRRLNRHSPGPLVAWHNGRAGIDHGAYVNDYSYSRLISLGNGRTEDRQSGQLVLHPGGGQDEFRDLALDAAGMSDAALVVLDHQALRPQRALRVERADLSGFVRWPILYSSRGHPGWLDFVACTIDGTRGLEPTDFFIEAMPSAEQVRVQNSDLTALAAITRRHRGPDSALRLIQVRRCRPPACRAAPS